jgi:hypothetical protein
MLVEPTILSEITIPRPDSVAVSGERVAGHGWVIGNAEIVEASVLIGGELVFLGDRSVGLAYAGHGRSDIAPRTIARVRCVLGLPESCRNGTATDSFLMNPTKQILVASLTHLFLVGPLRVPSDWPKGIELRSGAL